MADGLEFVGREVEENRFCRSLSKMSLERGEQLSKLGRGRLLLRPLERYDPSKGYLDSELEVGNRSNKAVCEQPKGRRASRRKAEQE